MSSQLIPNIFKPEVLAMTSYHVQPAQGLIKLDAMENPYTWPDDLQDQWLANLKHCALNRYPDPEAQALKEVLRQTYNIPEQASILFGNGSDEIIQLLLMALPTGASVLSPSPGFVMYKQISDALSLHYIPVPLQDDFGLDLPAMLEVITKQQPSIIFIAYPNNPTGNLFDPDAIRQIITASKGLVVIDEAYEPFAGTSFMNEVGQYSNMLVMRTVSKLGLAGLRLGYMAGDTEIIEQLNKLRLPYNINILTQASVEFALRHSEVFRQQTQAICDERARMLTDLGKLPGLTVFASKANFILFKTPPHKAGLWFTAIKQQGVLIKNLDPQGGLLADCLRVTIGKSDENDAFLAALKVCLVG